MADWDALLSEKPAPLPTTKVVDWDAALSQSKEPVLRPHNPRVSEAGMLPAKDTRYNPDVFPSSYLWNEIKKIPGGLVGLPADVVDWAIKKYAGEETEFGNITKKLQTATGADTEMKPPSRNVERAGVVVSNVAGSLPFAAAALPARGVAGAVTELVSGLGGSIGQVGAREAGLGPFGEITGNLLGSFLGFRAGNIGEKTLKITKTGLNMMASKEARAAASAKAQGMIEGSPEFNAYLQQEKAAAKTEIIDEIAKSYAQEDMGMVQKALDKYDDIKRAFPGFKASLGEITKNEPVLGMQSKLESANIPALEERGARIRANQTAIEQARQRLVPQQPGAARAALRGTQQALDDELRVLGQQESALSGELGETSQRMAGAARSAPEAGAEIKALATEGYAKSKGVADQKYQAFRAAVPTDSVADAGDVISKTQELRSKFVFDKEPEVIAMVESVAGKEKSLSVLQLDDLAAAANRDIQREASRSNPDRKVIAQLTEIRQQAQSTITKALAKEGNETALDAYAEARRYFGQEHAPKYLTGVNLKLRLKDALNEQRVKPEQVVGAYFKPQGATEAQRFNTQFADNGPAKETLARGVFDLYKREVIDKAGGVINPIAHDAFMRKYAEPLKAYPWISSRLDKNVVAGEITRRMTEVRANIANVAKSDLAKAVAGRDADAFIESALKDKRLMFMEMSKLSPENRKNMAIAVLNKAWDESGKGSAAVNKFLENEGNLKLLMRMGFGKDGEQHLNNIKLLARALEINETAPKISPMQALSSDSLKAKTGTTWVQVMSALRAIGRRPGSGDWFAMVFGAQALKARIDMQKAEIIKQQLFDPQLLSSTLAEYRAKGAGAKLDATGMATSRGKELLKKMGDLAGAFFGKDAAGAALKRAPVAAVVAEEEE